MKVTHEKIKANQENARLGGVKTEEGKEVSKMNALKHGILSNSICEFDELDTNSLFCELCEEFKAHNLYQKMLVEELVSTYVRVTRCIRIQKEVINKSFHTKYTSDLYLPEFGTTVIEEGYEVKLRESYLNQFELIIMRYEPQLVNRMLRLIKELKNLQEDM